MMVRTRLLALAREAPARVMLTAALALVATVAAVGQAVLLATVLYDLVWREISPGETGVRIAAIVTLTLVRATATWGRDLSGHWTAERIKQRLRADLYRKLLELGPGYAARRRTGDLQATIIDGVEALQAYVGFYIPQLFVAVVAPAALIIALFFIDPVVAGIVLLATLIAPLARHYWRRILSNRGQDHWDAYGVVSASMLDGLQGMVTLKTLNASGRYGERLRDQAVALYRATVANLGASLSVYVIVALALGAGTAMAVAVGGVRFADGHISALSMLLILFLTAEAFRPTQELQNYWHEGFYGLAASTSIFDLIDSPPIVHDTGQRVLSVVRGEATEVTLEGVSFTYEAEAPPALQDVSFTVPAGKTVAIAGRSGAGKSTLVALLQRFFDPDQGRITVNGVDLRDLRLGEARRLTAVVSQDIYLFHGTVEENLRMARPDATVEEVEAACRAANAHDFITALPDGYATLVGERGARLSGGERQRIAIARALLKDAPVLILDEATSSVDGASEAAIQEALANLSRGRTTIVVAHRLSALMHSDRVVVLDGGRVVEAGRPSELLARGGHYAELVRVQVEVASEAGVA